MLDSKTVSAICFGVDLCVICSWMETSGSNPSAASSPRKSRNLQTQFLGELKTVESAIPNVWSDLTYGHFDALEDRREETLLTGVPSPRAMILMHELTLIVWLAMLLLS